MTWRLISIQVSALQFRGFKNEDKILVGEMTAPLAPVADFITEDLINMLD